MNINSLTVLGVWLIGVVLPACVHLAFALAVANNAGKLPRGRKPELVGKLFWFLATLLGGPFVAGVYWIMHHSTICPHVYVACKEETAINQPHSTGTENAG